MTEEEFPFKAGDVVWFVTGSERCFEATRCTVTRFNKWKFEPYEVATISVDMAGVGPRCCLPDSLHLKPLPPPVQRSYTPEEVIAGFRFKPGDRVMQSNYGYGVVIGFSSTLTMRVDFKYFGERAVDPESLQVWFAQPGDEDWNPLLPPPPEPEPLCDPGEATLANLVDHIETWEEILSNFALIRQVCQSEYQHYLMTRETIHGVLNGFVQAGIPIPPDLQQRIDVADQAFIEQTEEDYCVWSHDAESYDRQRFWYFFRWPKL